MDILNVRASELMKKAMDGLSVRHQALSSNIANVDTPGYKPVKVAFEDTLKQAIDGDDKLKEQASGLNKGKLNFTQGLLDLRVTDQRHFGAKHIKLNEVNINAYQDDFISTRTDQNGIDIDTEMTELAKNSMQFEALATLQAKHFMEMKDIIKSGGQ